MSSAVDPAFKIRLEAANDREAINSLIAEVFGPGANARAAAALREGVDHLLDLSFVATVGDDIVGTCRLTPVLWGGQRGLMLGPLGVSRAHKGIGIGRQLMAEAVAAADDAGEPAIILVGDLPYYAPFGFERVAQGRITLPRPTDPMRILLRETLAGAASGFIGAVTRAL